MTTSCWLRFRRFKFQDITTSLAMIGPLAPKECFAFRSAEGLTYFVTGLDNYKKVEIKL